MTSSTAYAYRRIVESEADMVEAVNELFPVLSVNEWNELTGMAELCAIHGCDSQICADDQVSDCEGGSRLLEHRSDYRGGSAG